MVTMHKYRGFGNDYLIFDPNENQMILQQREIERLCQRKFGVEADGILYGPLLADGKMNVSAYNLDGNEVRKSGNGVRVFAKYLKDAGYVTEQRVRLATKAGDAEVEFLEEDERCIRVNMGKADFMSVSTAVEGIGHETERTNEPLLFHGTLYNTACLSSGDPYCVIMTEDVSCSSVKEPGSCAGKASYFPDRMNLQLCRVEDRSRLCTKTQECGAGYTIVSGTGACAAAAAAYRLGLVENQVIVEMPEDELLVEIGADSSIFMTGLVEKIETVILAENFFS